MVFVGGSNLALGMDSEQVEREIGLPVVNMGMNAGLGLRYMMDEVESQLREGDVVVLSPEYDHWYGSFLDGELSMLWALRVNPGFLRYLSSPKQYLTLAAYTPEFMQKRFLSQFARRQNPVYTRQAFNRYGDITRHLGLPSLKPLNGVPQLTVAPFNGETVVALRDFAERTHRRHITVLYVPPPLARSKYDRENREAIDYIEKQLPKIPHLVVIGKASEYVFPDSLFFDTIYHLNREGRQLRTKKAIAQIRQALAEPEKTG